MSPTITTAIIKNKPVHINCPNPLTFEEIEKFLWYDSSYGTDELSNTLKHKVVPYCLEHKKLFEMLNEKLNK